VGGLWATTSEGVGLTVRAISFQSYLLLIHQRYRQTGRADNMQSQYRALHYSASRGKKAQSQRSPNFHAVAPPQDSYGSATISSIAATSSFVTS